MLLGKIQKREITEYDSNISLNFNSAEFLLPGMLSKTLKTFLDKNKIKYETLGHRTVYTALDKAATLKVKPTMVGKTVIVSLDGKSFALGLIPAKKNLDKKIPFI